MIMSEKARDPRGRWRSVSVSFRVSPEEGSLLDSLVRISGLTKQEYLVRRVTQKDIVVQANPRVYKALKVQMEGIRDELSRLASVSEVTDEVWDLLNSIVRICDGMGGK